MGLVMRSLTIICLLFIALPSLAGTQNPGISARVVEFGVYSTRVTDRIDAPTTTTGELSLLSEPIHVRTTSTIPALERSSFGIRYVLEGIPDNKVIRVTDVITTPGLKRPESSDPVVYKETRTDLAAAGQRIFTGYSFDESWEAVPGDWTIEVWVGDTQLLKKEFTVVPAKPLRH